MYKAILRFFDRLEDKVRGFLSHYPVLYGFMAGFGIVLFWRGVWHTVDTLHLYFFQFYRNTTLDWNEVPWWDGPASLLAGSLLLLISGAFVSSFIGNEIIISGLRGEKKLTEKTENEVRTEVGAIADIKERLGDISGRLEKIEKQQNRQ